jgi:hypothetical protein
MWPGAVGIGVECPWLQLCEKGGEGKQKVADQIDHINRKGHLPPPRSKRPLSFVILEYRLCDDHRTHSLGRLDAGESIDDLSGVGRGVVRNLPDTVELRSGRLASVHRGDDPLLEVSNCRILRLVHAATGAGPVRECTRVTRRIGELWKHKRSKTRHAREEGETSACGETGGKYGTFCGLPNPPRMSTSVPDGTSVTQS